MWHVFSLDVGALGPPLFPPFSCLLLFTRTATSRGSSFCDLRERAREGGGGERDWTSRLQKVGMHHQTRRCRRRGTGKCLGSCLPGFLGCLSSYWRACPPPSSFVKIPRKFEVFEPLPGKRGGEGKGEGGGEGEAVSGDKGVGLPHIDQECETLWLSRDTRLWIKMISASI